VRADICEPDDAERIERFRSALRDLGAEPTKDFMSHGVTVIMIRVSGQTLTVFSDPWSIDVEGPDDLVTKLLRQLSNA